MNITEIKEILLSEDSADLDVMQDEQGNIKVELVYFVDNGETISLGEVSISEIIDMLYKRDGDDFVSQFESVSEDE